MIIKEADRRSRLLIPHDLKSPSSVVEAANLMALELWGKPVSFDQAASHVTAISINGKQLPFNAFCMQEEAAGVDMFTQWQSWENNVNYVYPPEPMTGRLLTFLPKTNAVAIVVLPLPIPCEWWSYTIQPFADGVMRQTTVQKFLITAFDFRASNLLN